MWIVLNNSFLSIVDQAAANGRSNNRNPKPSDILVVRGRLRGDIENVFPNADVMVTHDRDYMYRAFITRDKVADAVSREVMNIRYGNFKSSVSDRKRRHAYGDIWSVMYEMQCDEQLSSIENYDI
jgi:hypothetical protein